MACSGSDSASEAGGPLEVVAVDDSSSSDDADPPDLADIEESDLSDDGVDCSLRRSLRLRKRARLRHSVDLVEA